MVEPSQAEVDAFDTVNSIIKWAELEPQTARDSFNAIMGAPRGIRILASIPIQVFHTAINGWKVPIAQSEPPASADPTPSQIASGFLIFQAARHKCGLPFSLDPPSQTQQQQPIVGVGSAPTTRRVVKMSSVIDQTMDQEVQSKTPGEVANLNDKYIQKLGDEPPHRFDPTADQIACVEALNGADLNPAAVDCAVFGPHGQSIQRKLKFKPWILVGSEFVQQETFGPPTFRIWKACMKVLKIIAVMLNLIEPQRVDDYIDFVEELDHLYGPDAWGIIYQGDVEMRTQEMLRIRARLDRQRRNQNIQAADPNAPYDPSVYNPDRPWNTVFHRSIHGSDASDYWFNRVREPCLLLASKTRKKASLINDNLHHAPAAGNRDEALVNQDDPSWGPGQGGGGGFVLSGGAGGRGNDGGGKGGGDAGARTRSRTPGGPAKGADGKYLTNKKKRPFCSEYQSGNCRGGNVCPNDPNKVHQCWWCLRQHPGDGCGNPSWRPPAPTDTGKGGKGGKGGSKGNRGFRGGGAW